MSTRWEMCLALARRHISNDVGGHRVEVLAADLYAAYFGGIANAIATCARVADDLEGDSAEVHGAECCIDAVKAMMGEK